MNTISDFPLPAPRVPAVLDPDFARPCSPRVRSHGSSPRPAPAFRSGSHSNRPMARSSISKPRAAGLASACRGEPHARRTTGEVSSLVAGRMAHLRRRTTGTCRHARVALCRDSPGAVRCRLRRPADFRSPGRGRRRTRTAAGTLCDPATRPPPGWLPDRLRSRRQRSQGGRGDRWTRGLQRRNGVGSVPQARSPVSLRRHHGLAPEGRRPSAQGRRDRRQRRRRLRQQQGQGRLPVPGRAARVFDERVQDLFLEIRKAWNDVRSKSSTTAR